MENEKNVLTGLANKIIYKNRYGDQYRLGLVFRHQKNIKVSFLDRSYNRNKTNDHLLNLTPENVTQHSRIE